MTRSCELHRAFFLQHKVLTVLITFETGAPAQHWREEVGVPERHWPMLIDTKREVYAMLGMERSVIGSWGPQAIWWYLRHLDKLKTGASGDPNQMGGDYLVNRQATLLLYHPSRSSTDRPSVETIKEAILSAKNDQRSVRQNRNPQHDLKSVELLILKTLYFGLGFGCCVSICYLCLLAAGLDLFYTSHNFLKAFIDVHSKDADFMRFKATVMTSVSTDLYLLD
eukprot:g45885.t1